LWIINIGYITLEELNKIPEFPQMNIVGLVLELLIVPVIVDYYSLVFWKYVLILVFAVRWYMVYYYIKQWYDKVKDYLENNKENK
jgi:hypothetical protein